MRYRKGAYYDSQGYVGNGRRTRRGYDRYTRRNSFGRMGYSGCDSQGYTIYDDRPTFTESILNFITKSRETKKQQDSVVCNNVLFESEKLSGKYEEVTTGEVKEYS